MINKINISYTEIKVKMNSFYKIIIIINKIFKIKLSKLILRKQKIQTKMKFVSNKRFTNFKKWNKSNNKIICMKKLKKNFAKSVINKKKLILLFNIM